MRRAISGSLAIAAVPCSPMPTANSAWITPSCSSFAMRSRSSSSSRRASSSWARRISSYSRAFSIATPACVASTTSAASSSSVNSERPVLLGEVDVAEDLAEGLDRRSEERVHRRVVRREAGRPRVGADLGDAHRSSFPDQQPEDAVTHRRVADRGSLLVGHALGDESLDARSVLAEHAERSVTGPGDRHGQLHDPLEHGFKVELRREGESRLDQHARAARRREARSGPARDRLIIPSLATGSVRPVRWGAPDPGLERAPVLR